MKNNLYKNTFLIVYPAGSYGTFLDWCINWFSGQINEDILPFTSNGSAHKWQGNAAGDVILDPLKTIEWFLMQPEVPFTIRTHLNHEKADQETLIRSYQKNFKKIILINHNPDCHLLLLHNQLTKNKRASYDTTISEIIVKYKNQFDTSDVIPRWQLREMISYWHGSWGCQLRDMFQPTIDENIVNIDVKNLVYDFDNSLINLFDDLKLPMTRRDRLEEIRNLWLSLQAFKNLDQQLNNIVFATVNNDLTKVIDCTNIFDEAFVQWKLRVIHNLDLLCYGLDDFPKNVKDLKALLIPYAAQD